MERFLMESTISYENAIRYTNFRVYYTANETYIVKADSKAFGKQAIVYESYNLDDCLKWIDDHYTNKDGKIITNLRWTRHTYVKAMSTCNIPDNRYFRG